MIERHLDFDDPSLARDLFGPSNSTLRLISEQTGVELDSRGSTVTLRAPATQEAEMVANLLAQTYGLLKGGYQVFPRDVTYALRILAQDPGAKLRNVFQDTVFVSSAKKTITPKTLTQREFIQAIRDFDMVFAIGPAGSGKTYLAVAMAVAHLTKRLVKRIVLTRPVVEAGERLGFLPGDLVEKVNPYMRPLYDALYDMLDMRKVQEMIETGVIEIAPLAYMRGRTLDNAFVILDEAQNTTPEQMKMFVTRLGFGAKAIITGDVTQIDLPPSRTQAERSGLVHAQQVLADVKGLQFIQFNQQDVVRHPLVSRIVSAYERHEQTG